VLRNWGHGTQQIALLVAEFWAGKRAIRGAYSGMDDKKFAKFEGLLAGVGLAAMGAFLVGYIAHYDFGLSA
jgi:hypothetical protein